MQKVAWSAYLSCQKDFDEKIYIPFWLLDIDIVGEHSLLFNSIRFIFVYPISHKLQICLLVLYSLYT